MRFFSNDSKESAGRDDAEGARDSAETVTSDPVAVPQQRSGSPWSDTPQSTPDDGYAPDDSYTSGGPRTQDEIDLPLEDDSTRSPEVENVDTTLSAGHAGDVRDDRPATGTTGPSDEAGSRPDPFDLTTESAEPRDDHPITGTDEPFGTANDEPAREPFGTADDSAAGRDGDHAPLGTAHDEPVTNDPDAFDASDRDSSGTDDDPAGHADPAGTAGDHSELAPAGTDRATDADGTRDLPDDGAAANGHEPFGSPLGADTSDRTDTDLAGPSSDEVDSHDTNHDDTALADTNRNDTALADTALADADRDDTDRDDTAPAEPVRGDTVQNDAVETHAVENDAVLTDADRTDGDRTDLGKDHTDQDDADEPGADHTAAALAGAGAVAAIPVAAAAGHHSGSADDERPATVTDDKSATALKSADDEPATVDGESTADTPAAAAVVTDQKPGSVAEPKLETIFDSADAQSFQDRWREVQLRFVDSPREATDEAGSLVDEVVEKLTSALQAQRSAVRQSTSDDTEQLRVELRGYRDMLNRILGL